MIKIDLFNALFYIFHRKPDKKKQIKALSLQPECNTSRRHLLKNTKQLFYKRLHHRRNQISYCKNNRNV